MKPIVWTSTAFFCAFRFFVKVSITFFRFRLSGVRSDVSWPARWRHSRGQTDIVKTEARKERARTVGKENDGQITGAVGSGECL